MDAASEEQSEPRVCVGPDLHPHAPRFAMPAGATDCHCHVFADPARYPLAANRSYTPHPASLAEYLRMCEATGLMRTVQVNASVYGSSNAVTLDVIAQLGQHRARGVAGVSPDVSRAELEKLHEGGMRGVRLSTRVKGYGGMDVLEAVAAKIRPLGWHVQLHLGESAELAALEARLMRLEVPLVFDHFARISGPGATESAGFKALARLLGQRDDCWMKLSSYYNFSTAGAPDYADMLPIARALLEIRGERLVWGSNWPHPNRFPPQMPPNEGDLLDVLHRWAPDQAALRKILVDNPGALYGFPAI